jgi:DNA-directed RNA polymerase subunit RPC12/RpoP
MAAGEGRALPWCDQCDQRLEDADLTDEGTCPVCGSTPLAHRKSPWYFKFMLVATVVYLGYRAFQGVTWVVHHI